VACLKRREEEKFDDLPIAQPRTLQPNQDIMQKQMPQLQQQPPINNRVSLFGLFITALRL